jgi:hypothetical protein
MNLPTEVRVARIAGAFSVVVAVITLFGTLATADKSSSSALPASGTSTMVSSTPSTQASCSSVIRNYQILLRSDPKLAKLLTTVGPDGVSPIGVDPDARRCGVGRDVLLGMR